MTLRVSCTKASTDPPFPRQFSEYGERTDFRLLEPVSGMLVAGQPTLFRFACLSTPEVAVVQGSTWMKLKRNDKGVFEGSFVPAAGMPVQISIPKAGVYWGVLEYIVGK